MHLVGPNFPCHERLPRLPLEMTTPAGGVQHPESAGQDRWPDLVPSGTIVHDLHAIVDAARLS